MPTPESTAIPQIVVTCTLLDCYDTLSINLAGTIPSDYTLTATAPDGSSVQVHCIDGIAQRGNEKRSKNDPDCFPWGVILLDFAPDEITVTLKWDDNEVSQLFEPEYELHRPNGPNCEPECRTGCAVLDVPQNP
ncbi:MAG: hypothetical protein JXA42_06045 [Anaerolineales bacterium]|nr:hypothetical protein [Anaerolineales bacterium]